MFRLRTRRDSASPHPLDLSLVNVRPLDKSCVYNSFDCGQSGITKFLKSRALRCAERAEYSVYSAHLEKSARCIGYYALRVGSDTVPEDREHKKSYLGAGKYSSFPAIELSYLAVDLKLQGQGLGRHLLMDAMDVVFGVSRRVGVYAMTLQSLNSETTKFYENQGFKRYLEGSNSEPKLLYTIGTMKKLRAAAGD